MARAVVVGLPSTSPSPDLHLSTCHRTPPSLYLDQQLRFRTRNRLLESAASCAHRPLGSHGAHLLRSAPLGVPFRSRWPVSATWQTSKLSAVVQGVPGCFVPSTWQNSWQARRNPVKPSRWPGSLPDTRRRRRVAQAVAAPSVPVEKLSGESLDTWRESVAVLTSLGFNEEEAEVALCQGFGWRERTYWRDEIVDAVPDPGALVKVIEFLKECHLKDVEVKQLVGEFPHVLACSLEGRLKPNVRVLEKKWRITGPSLGEVLLRNPLVLGYTVDCGGDCIAECDYCWARF